MCMLPGMRLLVCLLILSLSIAGLATGDSAYAQLERLRKNKEVEAAPLPDPPMVSIPEGDFLMGADGTDALEDERPQHRVWVDRFEIDRYEVTTRRYAEFLSVTGRAEAGALSERAAGQAGPLGGAGPGLAEPGGSLGLRGGRAGQAGL